MITLTMALQKMDHVTMSLSVFKKTSIMVFRQLGFNFDGENTKIVDAMLGPLELRA